MKTPFGAIGAAVAASACCIAPVLFSLLGAGALGASAIKFEPYRPWFLGLTVVVLGVAFYSAYRPVAADTCADSTCTPNSKRTAKIIVWIAAALVTLLITFPYYISYLV